MFLSGIAMFQGILGTALGFLRFVLVVAFRSFTMMFGRHFMIVGRFSMQTA
jgi:hypothetical protein